MRAIRRMLQHRLNPLHVYCRLCDCGLGGNLTRRMCSVYERYVYRYLSL